MNNLSHFGEAGIALMGLLGWLFGSNPDISDQEYIEAHDLVHKMVVNGDVIEIDPDDPESYTSHELRDQLTPAQMQALQDEYEYRRMGGERN